MTEIGVGIIGCGIRGRHSYEHYLASHPAVRLRALSHYPNSSAALREGRTEEQDREYARQLGVEYYDEDFRSLLERDDVQIISLMVEPGQAADYVEQVAAAGKHIVSDKPMAGSVAAGQRIVDSVNRHRIKFMVALNERYAPPFRAAREKLASGSLGKLLAATCTYVTGGPLPGFTGSAAYRDSFGGGEFANFGCYCADYLNWLAQSRPLSVFAQTGSFFYDDYREVGMDDLGQCVVRYESGMIGCILAGRPKATLAAPYISADLTAQRGALHVDSNMPLLELAGEASSRLLPYGSPGLNELCRDFVDCVRNDTPSPISAQDGLASLKIVQAAYQSASTGRAVSL
ncbi:MAG: Gfo/Idh/MocA family protein [Armatimonadota bacterium]